MAQEDLREIGQLSALAVMKQRVYTLGFIHLGILTVFSIPYNQLVFYKESRLGALTLLSCLV